MDLNERSQKPLSQMTKIETQNRVAPQRTASKYIRNFENLFVPINSKQLCEKARNSGLEHCQFRSVCWRYFLHCLPQQYDQWLDSCVKSRQQYDQIKAKHSARVKRKLDQELNQSKNIQSSDDRATDGVRQQADEAPKDSEQLILSPPKTDFMENIKDKDRLKPEDRHPNDIQDCGYKDLFRTIERDVIRTYPDMEFFRQTDMQSILESVLFNFASENPHLSYKQGMHELLATLLYVLHTDSQNCLINYEGGYANETIATLLDLKYLEHDAYQLFSALMKSVETWYQNDEILASPSTDSVSTLECKNAPSNRSRKESSVLSIKLKKISENIVRKFDVELFNHLEALQIAPQIYGIRWMRLLFSREFEFLDLLSVWDAIICDDDSVTLSLTEYIFGALLISLRETLVNEDFTGCLNCLMRTQFKDLQFVIRLALHLRDPKNYPQPKNPSAINSLHKASLHNSRRFPSEMTSLASKLNQQYINAKRQFNDKASSFRSNITEDYNATTVSRQQQLSKPNSVGSRDGSSKSKMSLPDYEPQSSKFSSNFNSSRGSSYLVPSNSSNAANAAKLSSSSSNKFLPNFNRLVSGIGQSNNHTASGGGFGPHQRISPDAIASSSHQTKSQKLAQHPTPYHGRNENSSMPVQPKREYEMSEMQSLTSDSSPTRSLPMSNLAGLSDLLSEQIDTLQRCLPKEKSLHSEDEIFVALAQLKMVRDILKGSLRLEDERESISSGRNFGN